MPDKQKTLQTIADMAGVSRMTVSRALRNHPNVKDAVRQRILKIAEEIGYRPNPLISTLMADLSMKRVRQSGEVIAFLTADSEGPDQWKESLTARRFYEGAHSRAAQFGYRLEQFWGGDPDVSPARLSDILYNRSIHGVLLAPSYIDQYEYSGFDWSRFSVAALGYTLSKPQFHRACNNHYHTMREALQQVRKIGYKKIGLALSKSDDNRVMNNWQAAYLADRAIHSPRRQQLPVFLSETILEDPVNKPLFQKWLTRYRPEVVISIHHLFLLDWIRECGLKIPDDVGYVDLDLSDKMAGDIAGMNQNSGYVGYAAIELIIQQHHCNQRGVPQVPTITSLNGYWCHGETLRPSLG